MITSRTADGGSLTSILKFLHDVGHRPALVVGEWSVDVRLVADDVLCDSTAVNLVVTLVGALHQRQRLDVLNRITNSKTKIAAGYSF